MSEFSKTPVNEDPLLNIEEAAAYLRVPLKTLYNWRYRGVAPKGIKLGSKVFYRQSQLDAFIDAKVEG